MVDLSRMLEPAAGFARSVNQLLCKLTINDMRSLTFEIMFTVHVQTKCSMTTVAKPQLNMNHIESVQKVITYLGFSTLKKFKKVKNIKTLIDFVRTCQFLTWIHGAVRFLGRFFWR